jgi:hypothetical protein
MIKEFIITIITTAIVAFLLCYFSNKCNKEAIRRQLETNSYSAVDDTYMRQISTTTLPLYSVNDANPITLPPPAYSPEFVIQQGHNRMSGQSAQNGGERGFIALNVNQ